MRIKLDRFFAKSLFNPEDTCALCGKKGLSKEKEKDRITTNWMNENFFIEEGKKYFICIPCYQKYKIQDSFAWIRRIAYITGYSVKKKEW